MRKRGFVAVAAVAPIWALLLLWGWGYDKWQRDEPFRMEYGPGPVFDGAVVAAVVTTTFAFCMLLVDLMKWARQRSHERED